MDRLISLGVGTDGDDDYFQTHQDLSELARNLGATHNYVSMMAQSVVDDDSDTDEEELYYDENTLFKVREAMMINGWITGEMCDEIINRLQNAGILFRERKSS